MQIIQLYLIRQYLATCNGFSETIIYVILSPAPHVSSFSGYHIRITDSSCHLHQFCLVQPHPLPAIPSRILVNFNATKNFNEYHYPFLHTNFFQDCSSSVLLFILVHCTVFSTCQSRVQTLYPSALRTAIECPQLLHVSGYLFWQVIEIRVPEKSLYSGRNGWSQSVLYSEAPLYSIKVWLEMGHRHRTDYVS